MRAPPRMTRSEHGGDVGAESPPWRRPERTIDARALHAPAPDPLSRNISRHPRASGGPEQAAHRLPWIPDFAGMTVQTDRIPPAVRLQPTRESSLISHSRNRRSVTA